MNSRNKLPSIDIENGTAVKIKINELIENFNYQGVKKTFLFCDNYFSKRNFGDYEFFVNPLVERGGKGVSGVKR